MKWDTDGIRLDAERGLREPWTHFGGRRSTLLFLDTLKGPEAVFLGGAPPGDAERIDINVCPGATGVYGQFGWYMSTPATFCTLP